MAKKKTVKKSARPKAAKKRPARKVARQASAAVITPAAPTEEELSDDLAPVPPDGVVAADQVAAMPAEAQAQREVEQVVEEVTAGLPAVEARAAQAGGLGALAERRELIWLIGPARRPRTAIVGRALSDGAAISEVAGMTYMRIAELIRVSGLHHLRNEVREALAAYDAAPARHARTLAGLLGSAVRDLGALNVLQLATRQGMFLVNEGPMIFEGWPEWGRRDEESPALRRPRRRDALPPNLQEVITAPPALRRPGSHDEMPPTPQEVITAPPDTMAPQQLTLGGDGSTTPPTRPSQVNVRRRFILDGDTPPAAPPGGSSGTGP